MTIPTDAFPRFGLEELRRLADGRIPPGGRLLISQHIPTHVPHTGQGTPPHYSSSTKGPHHSSSSARKKHPPCSTSITKRARATGSSSGGTAEQRVAKTLQEQGADDSLEGWGAQRPRRSRDPGEDSTTHCRVGSGGESDSFGSGGVSDPFMGPGLPGAAGPTKIGLQSQLPCRLTPCH